ncbi:P27 family phage terminase small subunit [Vibrio parahaemolyticus]|nr:P27 family phage terminase small subunit [Vibrio parahaemolyticus]
MKTHVKMSEVELKTFQSIKSMLEAERELKPSDMDTVALLAVNMNILDKALATIECEGVMIISHTAYGQTTKANPAVALLHQTQQAIRALMDSLLMSPKAKASLNKADVEKKEEDDPLTAALAARANKRGV